MGSIVTTRNTFNSEAYIGKKRLIKVMLAAVFMSQPMAYAEESAESAGAAEIKAEKQKASKTEQEKLGKTLPSVEAQQQDAALGNVIVTSQKREEKIQDVPISIKAVSGTDIRDKNIFLSTDIERLAPNLSAQGGGRNGKPRWFLRGIGTNDPNQNNEGPLSIYVDEVPIILQKNQSFPLFDLERVEVLSGPQGTLWGKNNTGGAIQFISKKPSFDTGGYAKANLGRFDSQIFEGAYGGAIIDERLAARGSLYYETYDGWAKNILTDNYGPELKDINGRFQLLANLTENLEAQLILNFRSADISNNPSYTVGGRNAPGSAVTQTNPNGIITQGQTAGQIAAGGGYVPPYGDDPDAYSDFWGGGGKTKDHRNSAILKLNWQLGEYNLTSITGFVGGHQNALSLVGVPANTTLARSSTNNSDESKQLSQEIRLSSPIDRDITWIAGLYYDHLDAAVYNRGARFRNGGSATVGTNRDQYTESSWDQTSESQAIFGNVKFRFTEKAALGVGLRVTRQEKEITERSLSISDTAGANRVDFSGEDTWYQGNGVTFLANPTVEVLSSKISNTKVTGDITQEYRFSDDFLGYAKVATGFRSGGFNQSITAGQIRVLQPETIVDYEAGFKSTWLDGRLTFNTAVFYYDLKNIQLNIQQAVFDSSGTLLATSAAGQSDGKVQGIEFETNALITPNWHLNANLGLLRSEYTNFDYTVGGVQRNASGNEFYRTPKTSFRLDTDYTFHLSPGKLVLGTDWSFRSHIYHNATVQNDPTQETPSYWLGNARLTFVPHSKKWQVSAYANNITDRQEPFLRQIVNATNGTYPVSVGTPRTWGVTATINF